MTLTRKTNEEKLILELFRKYYPEFPKGRLQKSESPDFILKITPKKAIGIELTSLYNHKHKNQYNIDELEKIIRKKEEKIQLYQKKMVNELWLIISLEAMKEKSLKRMYTEIEKHCFDAQFNRVFLFDLFDKKILELVV